MNLPPLLPPNASFLLPGGLRRFSSVVRSEYALIVARIAFAPLSYPAILKILGDNSSNDCLDESEVQTPRSQTVKEQEPESWTRWLSTVRIRMPPVMVGDT